MVNYPISIHVKRYSGKKPNLIARYHRQLERANRIEKYINSEVKSKYFSQPSIAFDYYVIVDDLGLTKEEVHDILHPVDGGSNGITVAIPEAYRKRPTDTQTKNNKPTEKGSAE